jgi:hypothetical protein
MVVELSHERISNVPGIGIAVFFDSTLSCYQVVFPKARRIERFPARSAIKLPFFGISEMMAAAIFGWC